MGSIPSEFSGVTALTKANVYFDGKVFSHVLIFPNGSRRTLGIILPGTFHFGTSQPEEMQIISGKCRVKIDGADAWTDHAEGDIFSIEGDSGFEISVEQGPCQYLCSFIA